MDALDDILKIEERLVQKATQRYIPIGGAFELLPLCNMNCEMCYVRLSRSQQQAEGRLHPASEWLEIARQMQKAGTLFLLLTGGEPLLYPEFERLYRELKAMGMILTINTNGTLITPEIARMLGNDRPRRVNVTLYGADNETYGRICRNPRGFDQTMRGIRLLQENGVDIKLNGTLTPENCHQASRLQRIADELGLYLKIDTYLFPLCRRSREQFRPDARLTPEKAAYYGLLSRKNRYSPEEFAAWRDYTLGKIGVPVQEDCSLGCRAGRSSFWIRWNGDLTPCVFLTEPCGNVFETDFRTAWEQIVGKTACLHLPNCCGSCRYRQVCQICGAAAFGENGNCDDRPRYLCEMTRAMVKELEETK